MALPKLNSLTYELELPSTGEKLKYRPFLVKEQKALMIAQESEDDKQIENAFAQIITDCVLDEVDPYTMPMFDIEYVFLRIRGKSVGEKVKLNVLCPDDEKTRVDVEIDLEEVDVQMSEEHTNVVDITKDIKLIMRYPCLKDMSGEKNEWLGNRKINWAHAFAIVDFFEGGHFTVHVIQIIDGQTSLWGELIDGNI